MLRVKAEGTTPAPDPVVVSSSPFAMKLVLPGTLLSRKPLGNPGKTDPVVEKNDA